MAAASENDGCTLEALRPWAQVTQELQLSSADAGSLPGILAHNRDARVAVGSGCGQWLLTTIECPPGGGLGCHHYGGCGDTEAGPALPGMVCPPASCQGRLQCVVNTLGCSPPDHGLLVYHRLLRCRELPRCLVAVQGAQADDMSLDDAMSYLEECSPARLLGIAQDVCRGLLELHERYGWYHGCLSPRTVFLAPGGGAARLA